MSTSRAKPRPKAYDHALTPKLMKSFGTAHVRAYRLTGGLVGGRFRFGPGHWLGVPVCLITTVGRRTGRPRTTPLIYIEDGDRVVIAASAAGMPKDPLWYLNLQANPEVVVQIGRRRRTLRARTADEAERAGLWTKLLAMYPGYADYQAWTDRTIPIVVCEPAA